MRTTFLTTIFLSILFFITRAPKPPGGPLIYNSPMFYLPYCGAPAPGREFATVQVTMNTGNCGASLLFGCPDVRVIDSATHRFWPLPPSGYIALPARRTYFVRADLSNVTDSLANKFYVVVGWEECGEGIKDYE